MRKLEIEIKLYLLYWTPLMCVRAAPSCTVDHLKEVYQEKHSDR